MHYITEFAFPIHIYARKYSSRCRKPCVLRKLYTRKQCGNGRILQSVIYNFVVCETILVCQKLLFFLLFFEWNIYITEYSEHRSRSQIDKASLGEGYSPRIRFGYIPITILFEKKRVYIFALSSLMDLRAARADLPPVTRERSFPFYIYIRTVDPPNPFLVPLKLYYIYLRGGLSLCVHIPIYMIPKHEYSCIDLRDLVRSFNSSGL